jgi:3,4-dihydroxy 2-butanone 4-phosphate synthase / GTP cyclohydrolase II
MQIPTVQTAESPYLSRHGRFKLMAFAFSSGVTHVALVKGDPAQEEHPLVRVQSACLPSTALGGITCDCADQMDLAMQMVAAQGVGCILYLMQEGRGHGLLEKVAQFSEMSEGFDTVEAALRHGVEPDVRDYSDAAEMLSHLVGNRSIRLLTNDPARVHRLTCAGVAINERLPIEVEPTEFNRPDLLVKKHKMGHLLSRV